MGDYLQLDRNTFLEALLNLDIKKLECCLPENISYFGTTKANFLQRLKFLFGDYKLSGSNEGLRIELAPDSSNTYFLHYPAFEIYSEIIIEEKDGQIVKVYNNEAMPPKDEIEFLEPHLLIFGDDEAIDFEPTKEYLQLLNECNTAYRQLEKDQVTYLSQSDIQQWLDNHSKLYAIADEQYRYFKLNDFKELYYDMQYIAEGLICHPEVKQALTEYKNRLYSRESWGEKYNRLAYSEVLGFSQLFHEINYRDKTIQYRQDSNMFFVGNEFFEIIEFCTKYCGHVEKVNVTDTLHPQKIKFWQKHLNWFIPFISEHYPLTKFQLQKYEDILDWDRVSKNPFIKWNDEMKESYSAHVKNPIRFPSKELIVGLVNPEYYFQFFHSIPKITCDNVFISEREEEIYDFKIEWKDILFGNYVIPKIDENALMLIVDRFDCGINIAGELYKEIPIPTRFIEKNKNVINWSDISGYKGLNWSFELLQKFEDYWVTEQLIQNHTAFNYCLKEDLNDELIEKVLI